MLVFTREGNWLASGIVQRVGILYGDHSTLFCFVWEHCLVTPFWKIALRVKLTENIICFLIWVLDEAEEREKGVCDRAEKKYKNVMTKAKRLLGKTIICSFWTNFPPTIKWKKKLEQKKYIFSRFVFFFYFHECSRLTSSEFHSLLKIERVFRRSVTNVHSYVHFK